MLQPDRPAWIEVDLSAIVANISAVRQYVSPASEVLAVVKANAYGHGLIPVAKAALKGGASALGVALLQEGLALRKAGIRAPVVVLAPALPEQAECLIAHNLSQTTGAPGVLCALATAATRARGFISKSIPAWGASACPLTTPSVSQKKSLQIPTCFSRASQRMWRGNAQKIWTKRGIRSKPSSPAHPNSPTCRSDGGTPPTAR